MAFHLARRRQRFPSNSPLIRAFSNSSSDSPPKNAISSEQKPSSQSPSDSSSSSYSSPFTDIKTTLKQKLEQQQQSQGRNPFARSNAQSQNLGTTRFADLGKNLANFERRSTATPSRDSRGGVRPPNPRPQFSFESLYKQNVSPSSPDRKGQDFDPSRILDNLKNLNTKSNKMEKTGVSLGSFKSILKTMASDGGGGEAALPMEHRKESGTEEMKTEFLTIYTEGELGEKLKILRPEGQREEGWFSLQELNQRLVKLRQVEVKEAQNRRGDSMLSNIISTFENEKDKIAEQSIDLRGYMGLGATPEYMHHPPKEDLVDTYFHIDNLSSAEKMKIELTKVREEFKMSESDCGSARVQVAQLTTRIKHLSSALHKKDKHSRKGLLGMVQKRKKLLKYLRRTDWDSYCLVLSKLSLRDNPDYKF